MSITIRACKEKKWINNDENKITNDSKTKFLQLLKFNTFLKGSWVRVEGKSKVGLSRIISISVFY